jgi:hypothetical protein
MENSRRSRQSVVAVLPFIQASLTEQLCLIEGQQPSWGEVIVRLFS